MNLLNETLKDLANSHKKPEDVLWVGIPGQWHCSWQDFASVAENIDYDSGYGLNVIDMRVKIVGVDWWLARVEYDGSEWWQFLKLPQKPAHYQKPQKENFIDSYFRDCMSSDE